MPRPIQAKIHTSALAHNLNVARLCAPTSQVWSVIKANAYGHRIECAYAGLKNTDGFALLDLDEAIKLRQLGWQGPILLLEGLFQATDLIIAMQHTLTIVVHCEEQLRMLEAHTPSNQAISVYLKMNSGMNRLGFAPSSYISSLQRLQALPWVNRITYMTHFANADSHEHGIDDQMRIFSQYVGNAALPRSLANSAAVLWHPQAHANWIRPGIILYGASPRGIANDVDQAGLQAAMTLSSQLIATQFLKKGEAVGYGGHFVAPQAMRVGVVACGYADGYPRHAPNDTPIIVAGLRTRVLGRVSMDMLCVDLTPVPQASVGSPVELWGKKLPIDEVAKACGTIGYELMCAVAPRVLVKVDH